MNDICKVLKYLTDNNGYLFIKINIFLKGLGKTNKELSQLLIWLDENELVKFDSGDFRRLHARHAGIERGLSKSRIQAKLTVKGEKYFKDNCMEKPDSVPTGQQFNIGKVENLNTGENFGEFNQYSSIEKELNKIRKPINLKKIVKIIFGFLGGILTIYGIYELVNNLLLTK